MLSLNSSTSGHKDDRIWHLAWSHCGKFIATCSADKTIKLWNTACEPLGCIATLDDAHSRTVRACEFSPDGELIASASFDGTVIIWECGNISKTSWDQIASLEGHENEVKSVAWNKRGNYLATCGRDKRVWVWERLHEAEFECVCVLEGHSQDVKFVRWHPNLDVLYSASYDDTVKVWDEHGEGEDWYCSDTLAAHSSTVWGVALSPTGDHMVSCSADCSAILWRRERAEEGAAGETEHRRCAVLRDVHTYAILSLDWNPAAPYVATCAQDNSIVVLHAVGTETSSGAETLAVCCTRADAHGNDINCVR